MIIRKIFMLIATVALIGVVALTVVGLVPKFTEFDLGDPAAHFTRATPRYSLTVTKEGDGEVTGAEAEYEEGTAATVTAVPAKGYIFGGWYSNNGTPLSYDAVYTFTVEKNMHVVAKFVPYEE